MYVRDVTGAVRATEQISTVPPTRTISSESFRLSKWVEVNTAGELLLIEVPYGQGRDPFLIMSQDHAKAESGEIFLPNGVSLSSLISIEKTFRA